MRNLERALLIVAIVLSSVADAIPAKNSRHLQGEEYFDTEGAPPELGQRPDPNAVPEGGFATKFIISGMTCLKCPPVVDAALKAVPGVTNTAISVGLAFVQGTASVEDMIKAIEGASGPDGQKFTAKVAPGPKKVTLKVKMRAKTSTKGVRSCLEGIPGVIEVEGISFELGLAIVRGTASVEDMIEALDAEGYTAELTDPYECSRRRRLGEGPCKTEKLLIGGMSCGHCPPRVVEALEGVPGVTKATVTLDPPVATVEGTASVADLIAAVVKEGAGEGDGGASKFSAELMGECQRRRRRLAEARELLELPRMPWQSKVHENYDAHVAAWQSHTQQGWMDKWSDEMTCWWENTPLKAGLETCTLALNEVLAERFDSAKGRQHYMAHGEQGCEWVRALDEGLQLPSFPQFGSLPDFQLPVQLLPWSVQKWQEIGEQSALPAQQQPLQQYQAAASTTTTTSTASFDWYSFSAGASGVVGVSALVFVYRSARKAR